MTVELRKTFFFEAAHFLPLVAEGHKCRRMHGHNYNLDIVVAGECDPEYGWLMDYGDIVAIVKPIIDSLDHRVLNDVPGLENPTSENLAYWFWQKIKPELPLLAEIVVAEGPTSKCVFRG
ncbi:MAG: 6-carboxytetrahydropterin synthase QueD [Verrucomicrobia bacterium]|nr:6-carboxytetrahydropterin synthase QueD [Verrucomicrobiota bacterium]